MGLDVLIGQVALGILIGQVGLDVLIGQVGLDVLIGQVGLDVDWIGHVGLDVVMWVWSCGFGCRDWSGGFGGWFVPIGASYFGFFLLLC